MSKFIGETLYISLQSRIEVPELRCQLSQLWLAVYHARREQAQMALGESLLNEMRLLLLNQGRWLLQNTKHVPGTSLDENLLTDKPPS